MILQTLAPVKADTTKIMNSTVTGCRSDCMLHEAGMATPEDHLGGHVNYLTSTRVILYTPVWCDVPRRSSADRVFSSNTEVRL
jgi:hypothetical protein